jgi:hypothetical protein
MLGACINKQNEKQAWSISHCRVNKNQVPFEKLPSRSSSFGEKHYSFLSDLFASTINVIFFFKMKIINAL